MFGPRKLFPTEVNREGVVMASLSLSDNPTVCGCVNYDGGLYPPHITAASHCFQWSIEELMDRGAECNVRTTRISKVEQ